MSELKTLKDLRFTEKGDFWNWKDEMSHSKNCKQLVEELKQEAIKEIKFAKTKDGTKGLWGGGIDFMFTKDVIGYIKWKFNIEEGDLK